MASKNIAEEDMVGSVATPIQLRIGNVLVRILYFWTVFGIAVLSLRVFLLAFSANPSTKFVTFIYDTSARYLEPFRGIFPTKDIGQTGYLDVSALFAIIMYLFFVWGVSSLINFVEHKIAVAQKQSMLEESTNSKKPRKEV